MQLSLPMCVIGSLICNQNDKLHVILTILFLQCTAVHHFQDFATQHFSTCAQKGIGYFQLTLIHYKLTLITVQILILFPNLNMTKSSYVLPESTNASDLV